MKAHISALSHLTCTHCKKKHDPHVPQTICSCGNILFAQYDIEKAKETLSPYTFEKRPHNIWRLAELMPVINPHYRFTLGEGGTPVLKLNNLGKTYHTARLFLKDEGQNPTGTFKSRGLCSAVSKGVELGIKNFTIPTAGNAGAALSAYAAASNTNAYVFMPKDAPDIIKQEVVAFGGKLTLIEGLISDAATIVQQKSKDLGWFDVSTLKEPYRVEGKKTMGFEIAEQFNWEIPDVIIYPTGGGTGIIGMWKAFQELEALGLIGSKRPRMIAVQATGCAPIVDAFNKKHARSAFWNHATTIAAGLRVPKAFGDYLILKALYESNGAAVAVKDEDILKYMKIMAKKEGILLGPEAAATVAGFVKLLERGCIDKQETIVLFATGSGLLTPEFFIH